MLLSLKQQGRDLRALPQENRGQLNQKTYERWILKLDYYKANLVLALQLLQEKNVFTEGEILEHLLNQTIGELLKSKLKKD